jgi:hypothetical protein
LIGPPAGAYGEAVEPVRSVLAPGLRRWVTGSTEEGTDERTVVVRLATDAGAVGAPERLRALGAEVRSIGAGSVTCVVTPATLRALTDESWVAAVEEPRRLFPRSAAGR